MTNSAYAKNIEDDFLHFLFCAHILKTLAFESLLKGLSHGAIFLATCNAILLLRDVN